MAQHTLLGWYMTGWVQVLVHWMCPEIGGHRVQNEISKSMVMV